MLKDNRSWRLSKCDRSFDHLPLLGIALQHLALTAMRLELQTLISFLFFQNLIKPKNCPSPPSLSQKRSTSDGMLFTTTSYFCVVALGPCHSLCIAQVEVWLLTGPLELQCWRCCSLLTESSMVPSSVVWRELAKLDWYLDAVVHRLGKVITRMT